MFVVSHARPVRPVRPTPRRVELAPSLVQLVDRWFDAATIPATAAGPRTPALDVDETASHYLLKFDLPGAERELLKVSVEGRRVRVETVDPAADKPVEAAAEQGTAATAAEAAQPAANNAADQARPVYRERGVARYARTVSLPKEVDSDASDARLEHGVLTLRLAKRNADGARRLTIN